MGEDEVLWHILSPSLHERGAQLAAERFALQRLYGVDPSNLMLRTALKKLQRFDGKLQLHLRLGDDALLKNWPNGPFDAIASIEMFEAVGEKYWPQYFGMVMNRLRPGAKATLQIITIKDARFEVYRKSIDFIQKYVFPGGMLPSPSALRHEIETAGLHVLQSIEFGKSYSTTLRRWHEMFNARWSEMVHLGFDDRFRRMWNFYLTSCAGAFEGGNCDVTQITIARPVG